MNFNIWQFLILCIPAVTIHELGHLSIAKLSHHKIGRMQIGFIRIWKFKIPVGIGFEINHEFRTISDLIAGVVFEIVFWFACGLILNSVYFLVIFATIAVNWVPWFPGNDGWVAINEIVCYYKGMKVITKC